MPSNSYHVWFEKVAALVFLILLIALVVLLIFVPLPQSSENVILVIIGALTGEALKALGHLFGYADDEKDRLQERLSKLEVEYDTLEAKYDKIMEMLVKRHVVKGAGIRAALAEEALRNEGDTDEDV